MPYNEIKLFNYHKSLLRPRGAFLISGPEREGLNRKGGGGLFQIIYFDEIQNNFSNFTITPITKTEQETGFVSPF